MTLFIGFDFTSCFYPQHRWDETLVNESLLSFWTNPDPVLASPKNRVTVWTHDSSHASDWLWFWGSANHSEWPRGTETAWSFLPAISPSAPFQSAVKLIYSAPHFYNSKDYFPIKQSLKVIILSCFASASLKETVHPKLKLINFILVSVKVTLT